jgi:hypothetical protein
MMLMLHAEKLNTSENSRGARPAIEWGPSFKGKHGEAPVVIVNDSVLLVRDLLPLFDMAETQFSSLVRKLYRWGFRQISKAWTMKREANNQTRRTRKESPKASGVKIFMCSNFRKDNYPLLLKMTSRARRPKRAEIGSDGDDQSSTDDDEEPDAELASKPAAVSNHSPLGQVMSNPSQMELDQPTHQQALGQAPDRTNQVSTLNIPERSLLEAALSRHVPVPIPTTGPQFLSLVPNVNIASSLAGAGLHVTPTPTTTTTGPISASLTALGPFVVAGSSDLLPSEWARAGLQPTALLSSALALRNTQLSATSQDISSLPTSLTPRYGETLQLTGRDVRLQPTLGFRNTQFLASPHETGTLAISLTPPVSNGTLGILTPRDATHSGWVALPQTITLLSQNLQLHSASLPLTSHTNPSIPFSMTAVPGPAVLSGSHQFHPLSLQAQLSSMAPVAQENASLALIRSMLLHQRGATTSLGEAPSAGPAEGLEGISSIANLPLLLLLRQQNQEQLLQTIQALQVLNRVPAPDTSAAPGSAMLGMASAEEIEQIIRVLRSQLHERNT